ncbi:methyltransferase [Candidatus Margulisiibacteriota bacterium]
MKIFEKQSWMLLFLITAIYFFYSIVTRYSGFLSGSLWGIRTLQWIQISVLCSFLHHFLILICWRIQLHYSLITKYFGMKGFYVYAFFFFLLLILRTITLFFLGYANRGSLLINPFLLHSSALVIMIPVSYTLYSIIKYFGLLRATGIDHFDPAYRKKPFVKKGMFKYTKNAMYTYGVLLFLIPGLLFASKTALLIGLINYCWAWIHYFTIELPDIKKIYTP